jgi:hypothetical protein
MPVELCKGGFLTRRLCVRVGVRSVRLCVIAIAGVMGLQHTREEDILGLRHDWQQRENLGEDAGDRD